MASFGTTAIASSWSKHGFVSSRKSGGSAETTHTYSTSTSTADATTRKAKAGSMADSVMCSTGGPDSGKAQNRAMRKRPLPLARLQQVTPIDRGLTGSEVQQRRELYGLNDIVEVPGNPWLELARDTAKDPMIWFFAGTGIVYGLAGQQIEAITLLAAILPLLGMDVF